MSNFFSKLRDYAELSRISNLPTTFSNVLVGAAIGISGLPEPLATRDLCMRMFSAWLAVACFYIAGMAMNDFADATIDEVERPHQPIPSRRISRRAAGRFIIALILIGLAILSLRGTSALAAGLTLVVLIVAYNSVHSLSAASVVLLGLSRGMVYLIAGLAVAEAVHWDRMIIFGGAMAVYVAAFSMIARRETQPHIGRVRWLSVLASFAAIVPLFILQPSDWLPMVLPLVLATAWLSRGIGKIFRSPPSIKQAVMIWISGICLIDALYLAMLWQGAWWVIAIACFIVTIVAHRRIVGT